MSNLQRNGFGDQWNTDHRSTRQRLVEDVIDLTYMRDLPDATRACDDLIAKLREVGVELDPDDEQMLRTFGQGIWRASALHQLQQRSAS